MKNSAVSFNSIPSEGTSQIFVKNGGNTGEGFKDIFVSQTGARNNNSIDSGKSVQGNGNNPPASQADEKSLTENDNENQPVFVDPPKDQATEAKAEQVTVPGFQGEAFPASDIINDPSIPEELYALTDADLTDPAPAATAITTAADTPEEAAIPVAGLTELASLQAGNYGEAIDMADTSQAGQVEIAALTTRPFVQPIPATGEISTGAAAPDATAKIPVTPATGSVSLSSADTTTLSAADALQTAVKNASIKQDTDTTVATTDTPIDKDKVTPATSSGFINGEKLADVRQIQAYTEAMTGRTNDGSVPNSQASPASATIDIAAMNTRMAQSGTAHLQQSQTSPHALNFREKGWETSFGQNIMWMANKDIKTAQIRIKPAELGPIHIELSMHKDQMTLQINASHHLARDTLEAALPRLRAELNSNGFGDANINVGDQAKGGQTGGQSDSSAMDQQSQAGQPTDDIAEDPENVIPATSAMNLMSGTASLLDTFA